MPKGYRFNVAILRSMMLLLQLLRYTGDERRGGVGGGGLTVSLASRQQVHRGGSAATCSRQSRTHKNVSSDRPANVSSGYDDMPNPLSRSLKTDKSKAATARMV